MKFSFILPFFYFSKTRLKTNGSRVAWLFTYFVPVFISAFLFGVFGSVYDAVAFCITIVIVNYAYEWGYIVNDVITIKREVNPTLRLSLVETTYAQNNISRLFLFRNAIILFLFFLLSIISGVDVVIGAVLVYVAIHWLYFIYNRVRSLLNLYLILPLTLLRFFGPVLIFIEFHSLFYFLTLVIGFTLLYPLEKFFEFSARKRFNIIFSIRYIYNFNVFRVWYYLSIVFIFGLCVYFYEFDKAMLIIALYYLLYRLLCLLLVERVKFVKSSYDHDKHIGQ